MQPALNCGQLDIENRTRSSHDLGARYTNAPANLDSVNALSFQEMTLTDINRSNDRTNSLFVMDIPHISKRIPFLLPKK